MTRLALPTSSMFTRSFVLPRAPVSRVLAARSVAFSAPRLAGSQKHTDAVHRSTSGDEYSDENGVKVRTSPTLLDLCSPSKQRTLIRPDALPARPCLGLALFRFPCLPPFQSDDVMKTGDAAGQGKASSSDTVRRIASSHPCSLLLTTQSTDLTPSRLAQNKEGALQNSPANPEASLPKGPEQAVNNATDDAK